MRQNASKFMGTKPRRMDGMMNSSAPVQKDLSNLENWAAESWGVLVNRIAKLCASSRKPPCMGTVWERTGWIAALQKKNWGLWWAWSWMQAKGECKWNYINKEQYLLVTFWKAQVRHEEFLLHQEGGTALKQAAQRDQGVSILSVFKTWLDTVQLTWSIDADSPAPSRRLN